MTNLTENNNFFSKLTFGLTKVQKLPLSPKRFSTVAGVVRVCIFFLPQYAIWAVVGPCKHHLNHGSCEQNLINIPPEIRCEL